MRASSGTLDDMGRALRLLLGGFALAATIVACSLTDTTGLSGGASGVGNDAGLGSADDDTNRLGSHLERRRRRCGAVHAPGARQVLLGRR